MDERKIADNTVNFGLVGIPSNAKSVAIYDLLSENKIIENVTGTAYTGKGHSYAMYRLVPDL